ncbi:hypothetical protein BCR34DRAFT_126558 [Clohesyomyces aquaticus]|uniref:Mid2 domain-containing protein n=1 Tax=Clohesyomyces aquaticus TaxID=1231657 RepID=A0A1Y1YNE3_9PLEO|nr:hypothetical protein BCR34DRAFT_126558 [Clohesyomyces aquaticus]
MVHDSLPLELFSDLVVKFAGRSFLQCQATAYTVSVGGLTRYHQTKVRRIRVESQRIELILLLPIPNLSLSSSLQSPALWAWVVAIMFPWRTFVSIFLVAFIFAVITSELNNRKSAPLSSPVRKRDAAGIAHDQLVARFPAVGNQLEYDSGLHRRDVCNDSFPGRYSQTCSPSRTLCCIIPGASRPSCNTILGFGFCCTEHTDCFVDTKTACGDTGSSQCAPGLCCPANTNCVANFNYTTDSLVRCNVDRNLIPGYTSSSSSTSIASSSSSASATSSASTTGTATQASATSNPTSPAQTSVTSGGGSAIGGGAIAGIVIGAIAAISIGLLLGWWCFKRSQKKKPVATAPPFSYQDAAPGGQMYEAPPNGAGGYYQPEPAYKYGHVDGHAEMPGEARRSELP